MKVDGTETTVEQKPGSAPGRAGWWASWRKRYEGLVEEYGWSAIGTYLVLFFGTWFAFWVAIKAGFELTLAGTAAPVPGGAASSAGTVGGAWVATKLTQPIRIGLTVVLTPLVVKAKHALWR